MNWLEKNGLYVVIAFCLAVCFVQMSSCVRDVRLAETEARNIKANEGIKFKFGITREPKPEQPEK